MKFSKNKNRNLRQRGVALLMVLAGLALLTGVVVEFAYNSNVNYNLALNDLDRTQAYYLAESGINFGKLLLKFEVEAQKVAKDASKKMGKDIQVPPLYEMIPLDTALFRGLTNAGGEISPPAGQGTGEEVEEPSALEQSMALIDLKGAEDFLAFKGDFSVEFSEEDSKLNLNAFYSLDPKNKAYDQLKNILYHLLATDAFEGVFSDRYRDAAEMAQNIADYIDKDDARNEPGGQERGREGISSGDQVKMKNGKLLSVEELALVPGMNDEVLKRLKEFVTVYGADGKINICRAKVSLIQAVIFAYSESNPNIAPLKHDNQELLDNAVQTVQDNCPNIQTITTELNKVLGIADTGTSSSGGALRVTASKTGQNTTVGGDQQNSTSQSFGDLVKDNTVVYSIVGIGTVGDSQVKLKTVLDTSTGDPKNWKEIYWRVE